MNKKIVHDALILTAFTLVLGLILGFVHELTKDPIEQANIAAAEAAYKEVFAEADSFAAYDGFDKEAANKVVADAGYADEISDVQTAYDSAKSVLGYVITVTAKDASQDNITFSVGIQNDGTVNGYSITSIAETPGLGIKAKDEEFYSQFQNKKADVFTVVKSAPSADSEIESISGATITSKAMANGVNACLVYFQSDLAGGAE